MPITGLIITYFIWFPIIRNVTHPPKPGMPCPLLLFILPLLVISNRLFILFSLHHQITIKAKRIKLNIMKKQSQKTINNSSVRSALVNSCKGLLLLLLTMVSANFLKAGDTSPVVSTNPDNLTGFSTFQNQASTRPDLISLLATQPQQWSNQLTVHCTCRI
jgi:hypothetical protein